MGECLSCSCLSGEGTYGIDIGSSNQQAGQVGYIYVMIKVMMIKGAIFGG